MNANELFIDKAQCRCSLALYVSNLIIFLKEKYTQFNITVKMKD